MNHKIMRFTAVLIILGIAAAWGESHPPEVAGFAGSGLHLYPLGWSSEGRWGALVGKEGSGNVRGELRIIIVDSVTDDVLYESDTLQWEGPVVMEEIWRRKSVIIKKILTSYDLEFNTRLDVRDPTFITGGKSYSFVMTPPSPASHPYSLSISSSRGDSKVVHSSAGTDAAKRAWLLGALLSPFEQRALAVLREESSNGEVSYRFVGAHLTEGFVRVGKTKTGSVPTGSLLTAIFNGQEYLVKSRLEAGADPDIRDSRGYPAILIAARLGHWNILSDLLAAGANPHPRDSSGFTALHHAVYTNNARAVRELLAAGAKKNARDGAGRIPAELTTDVTIRALLE